MAAAADAWAERQLQTFRFSFEKADKDNSGNLSFDELFIVLQGNGFRGDKAAAQVIFNRLDADGSKTVSKDEFVGVMKTLPRISIREYVLRKAFKQVDKDNSGFLSKAEIMGAMDPGEGEIKIAQQKLQGLLDFLERESTDNKVNYEEYLELLNIETTATVMRRIFGAIDADGNGFLTRTEILDSLQNEQEVKFNKDKITELVIGWCKESDKKMNYNEFIDVWMKQHKANK